MFVSNIEHYWYLLLHLPFAGDWLTNEWGKRGQRGRRLGIESVKSLRTKISECNPQNLKTGPEYHSKWPKKSEVFGRSIFNMIMSKSRRFFRVLRWTTPCSWWSPGLRYTSDYSIWTRSRSNVIRTYFILRGSLLSHFRQQFYVRGSYPFIWNCFFFSEQIAVILHSNCT